MANRDAGGVGDPAHAPREIRQHRLLHEQREQRQDPAGCRDAEVVVEVQRDVDVVAERVAPDLHAACHRPDLGRVSAHERTCASAYG
ncbi:hypothetical protein [Nonomuraea sp. B19D2]|uniref:hypothetical protein n=1 Tax=Nonomuraea sp. B19D2 TaxID=3159561 RepID=UPI0032DB08CA